MRQCLREQPQTSRNKSALIACRDDIVDGDPQLNETDREPVCFRHMVTQLNVPEHSRFVHVPDAACVGKRFASAGRSEYRRLDNQYHRRLRLMRQHTLLVYAGLTLPYRQNRSNNILPDCCAIHLLNRPAN